MKRFFIFLFCICFLALFFTGCFGGTVWNISAVELMGVEISLDEFSEMAGADMSDMKIELKAEGTAILTVPDLVSGGIITQTGKWEKTDGGYLVLDQDGTATELYRQRGQELVMIYGIYRFIFVKA